MFVRELTTANPAVKLVRPDVERDAALGVAWLAGKTGRATLTLMGVADQYNHVSTLAEERARVQKFLDSRDQYNWMISYHGRIVGTVWADLATSDHIGQPAVSIMLGDPAARGQGVGSAALGAVMAELKHRGHQTVYARHLAGNTASAALLRKAGFRPDGPAYTDEDGLRWQNAVYH